MVGRPGRDQILPTDSGSENGMARTARKLRVRADYLIVGGGMAGLSALVEARRRGIDAICLEAHAKPGGRIRTVRKRRVANYPIELGAEFVPGPLMKRLCESLGLGRVVGRVARRPLRAGGRRTRPA